MAARLSDRLQDVVAEYRQTVPAFYHQVDTLALRLREHQTAQWALNIGETFPELILPDSKGAVWRLSKVLEQGPVVVSIHRGSWCPLCQEVVRALGEIQPSLDALSCQLLAISPEGAIHAKELAALSKDRFPVLCDIGLALMTTAGLTYMIGDSFESALETIGITLDNRNSAAGSVLPLAATFVLDRQGVIVARFVDEDPAIRMEPEDILQAVRAASQSAARN